MTPIQYTHLDIFRYNYCLVSHYIDASVHTFIFVFLLITVSVNVSADAAIPCTLRTSVSFGMPPISSANLTEVWTSKINRQIQKKSCFNLSFGSAVDFRRYMRKAKRGDFDVLAVPAHIASYLISTAGFKPIAVLVWESSYLYVVPAESTISSIDQIGGASLSLPDPLAEVSILAQAEVSSIHGAVDYQHLKNYNLIIQALLEARTDVGVVLSPFFNGYKKHINNKVRVIHTVPFPSHGMLLAAPHTSEYVQTELFNTLSILEPGSGFFWQAFERVSLQKIEHLHRVQAASVETLRILLEKD